MQSDADSPGDDSNRLSGITSSVEQLQESADAELRAYLHMFAFFLLSCEHRGVNWLPATSAVSWSAVIFAQRFMPSAPEGMTAGVMRLYSTNCDTSTGSGHNAA